MKQQMKKNHLNPAYLKIICYLFRDERQRMVYPNCHPTYNERHEKIIEMINWTLEKYKANKKNTQQNKQEVIIDDIIKELAKKRDIARHEKKQAQPKDEVSSMYRLKEDTIICSFQNS